MRAARAGRTSVADLAPDAAAALTVLVLSWPMWRWGGYGLARDMVFTPRHPLDADAIGMGSTLPRAVPLDAVLGVLTTVIDGAVVFRLAVGGVLLLAGFGAHRMLRDQPVSARVLVAVLATWNPFVVERLALGQWALLASYASLWWLLPALRRVLDGDARALAAVVLWGWLGSLTPTGGVLMVLVTAATCLLRRRTPRRWLPLVLVLLGQLPWVLPGLLAGSGGTSDPAAVTDFAARAERPGGALLTLLGTGGTWSRFTVPPSLGGALGFVLTAAVAGVLLGGGREVWRRMPGLVVAGALGFVLASLAHLPGGDDLLVQVVAHVPGGGLLRDGQKWLVPYVMVVVLCAGRTLARVSERLGRADVDVARLLTGVAALVPLLLLPDAASRTWAALRPVTMPPDLVHAVAVLDRAPASAGAVVTLPWASYRQLSWGNPLSVADPLPRWAAREVVVSDALRTPSGLLHGEDRRAGRVGAALRAPDPSAALTRLGVGFALVYRDQPGSAVIGGIPLVRGPTVALYRLPGRVVTQPDLHPSLLVGAVAAADLAWGAILVGCLVASAVAARRRTGSPRDPRSPAPEHC